MSMLGPFVAVGQGSWAELRDQVAEFYENFMPGVEGVNAADVELLRSLGARFRAVQTEEEWKRMVDFSTVSYRRLLSEMSKFETN